MKLLVINVCFIGDLSDEAETRVVDTLKDALAKEDIAALINCTQYPEAVEVDDPDTNQTERNP